MPHREVGVGFSFGRGVDKTMKSKRSWKLNCLGGRGAHFSEGGGVTSGTNCPSVQMEGGG